MSSTVLLLLLLAPTDGPTPAAPVEFHPQVELGFGLGVVNEDIGLIPRLRGGVTLGVGVPNLVLGGDIAVEAFLEGDDGEGFTGRSYAEVMLTPRMFVGYEVPMQAFSFVPYGYFAVGGGLRMTTRRFFRSEDTTTDIAYGGRAGLGLGFHVTPLIVALEVDAGWKDLGIAGSATLNVGASF